MLLLLVATQDKKRKKNELENVNAGNVFDFPDEERPGASLKHDDIK